MRFQNRTLPGFEKKSGGEYIGYKVMAQNKNGELVSGADNRQVVGQPDLGSTISMPGSGVYLSNNPQYVLDYYSNLAEHEVLLKLSFIKEDIVDGIQQLNDNNPEIGVRNCNIEDFMALDADFVLPDPEPEAKKHTISEKKYDTGFNFSL